ncbi:MULTISPECIES: PD40 domain-containing protein [unclassified Imperialibacter]|uniref:PD40 domain-containing protein n=1 Tax=unclassified Imperialibacter TaxID=2629706 RepID=UPI00125559A9|nr:MULTISPECIES: PD40 domain-containing protein [unclassified Imperialibacter]CAD5276490.1 conserved hypothetical protein [Imperialibacter sp. 89]CAD5294767.1 conserved hypothetical protein [Imperialibacter sp. 75]VVT26839.1 conserved hypothetical protein [Imperialibacter sp. EC-SDR9]
MKFLVKIFFILLIASSCDKSNKYSEGHFPDDVVNFEAVNSSADDYNMDLPVIHGEHMFHFSSNRGDVNHYDIVGKNLILQWDYAAEHLTIDINKARGTSLPMRSLFDSVNTFCNELGPYSFTYETEVNNNTKLTYLFLYANDCAGNFDIKFTYVDPTESSQVAAASPIGLAMVNTEANELYPAFFGKDFKWESRYITRPASVEKLVYCSDKDGVYDFYQIDMTIDDPIVSLSSAEAIAPEKLSISSAEGNDKCAFINGRLMVFTSDRPGGYGGFDLYYSLYEGNAWSEPVNFGERINTEFDEYRPVILTYDTGFDNNLLLFSSNRPGGKGGFDLYYVGVEKMIN